MEVTVVGSTVDISGIPAGASSAVSFTNYYTRRGGQNFGDNEYPVADPFEVPTYGFVYALKGNTLQTLTVGSHPVGPTTSAHNRNCLSEDDSFVQVAAGTNLLDTIGWRFGASAAGALPVVGDDSIAMPGLTDSFLDFGNGPVATLPESGAAVSSARDPSTSLFFYNIGWDFGLSAHPEYSQTMWVLRVDPTGIEGFALFTGDGVPSSPELPAYTSIFTGSRATTTHWLLGEYEDSLAAIVPVLVEWLEPVTVTHGALATVPTSTVWTPAFDTIAYEDYYFQGGPLGFVGIPNEATVDRRPILVSTDWATYQFINLTAGDTPAQDLIDLLELTPTGLSFVLQADENGIFYMQENSAGTYFAYSGEGAIDPGGPGTVPPPPQFFVSNSVQYDPFIGDLIALIPSPYPPPGA